jgi:hypothetical protein
MRIVKESELVKSARVNVRISNRMAAWLAPKAGKGHAAVSQLTEEDRGDREFVAVAFADRE